MKYILRIEQEDDDYSEKVTEVTFTSKDRLIRHLMDTIESYSHLWPTLRKED